MKDAPLQVTLEAWLCWPFHFRLPASRTHSVPVCSTFYGNTRLQRDKANALRKVGGWAVSKQSLKSMCVCVCVVHGGQGWSPRGIQAGVWPGELYVPLPRQLALIWMGEWRMWNLKMCFWFGGSADNTLNSRWKLGPNLRQRWLSKSKEIRILLERSSLRIHSLMSLCMCFSNVDSSPLLKKNTSPLIFFFFF